MISRPINTSKLAPPLRYLSAEGHSSVVVASAECYFPVGKIDIIINYIAIEMGRLGNA